MWDHKEGHMKKNVLEKLIEIADRNIFSSLLTDLLVNLCMINTIPTEDKKRNADSEEAVYRLIGNAIREHALNGYFTNHVIRDEIKTHPAYTKPYYQHDEDYSGRYNLLHIYEGEKGLGNIALNAHIDTVAPYFGPSLVEGSIVGRGASDDKGCCVAIIGALMLLNTLRKESGIVPKGTIVSMFVTDEESGGNGSLSVATDRNLAALYDTVLVCESTEGKLYPANRGALWYKLELSGKPEEQLAFALKAVEELEDCGRNLRSESDHPLFPSKPVQTCHGMLGTYGEHPSRTCGRVVLKIQDPPKDIEYQITTGLSRYIERYGDRTVKNQDTGERKLERHLDIEYENGACMLTIWGTPGHMGKALENDSAILKAAWIAKELYRHIHYAQISLEDTHEGILTIEGGQGFLPTHTIDQVKKSMRQSIEDLFEATGKEFESLSRPVLSFDKLHNDAFAREVDSQAMKSGLTAARLLHIPDIEPVTGFQVSCDARIFANEYPEKQVITVGPGSIGFAHTDNEQISRKELTDGALQLALSILLMTGTCSPDDFT